MLTDIDYIYGHRYGDGEHSGIRCPECGSANVLIVHAGRDVMAPGVRVLVVPEVRR